MTDEIQETLRLKTLEPSSIRFGPNSVLKQRYRLDSEIGRGGMGVVYRATDLDLHREVAIKVLPERASAPDARERFMREARAAATLNLPNNSLVPISSPVIATSPQRFQHSVANSPRFL